MSGTSRETQGEKTPAALTFTERQREVACLIAAGCSNLQIAETLRISPRLAKAHVDTLKVKLGVFRRRLIPLAFLEATGVPPEASFPEGSGGSGEPGDTQ